MLTATRGTRQEFGLVGVELKTVTVLMNGINGCSSALHESRYHLIHRSECRLSDYRSAYFPHY